MTTRRLLWNNAIQLEIYHLVLIDTASFKIFHSFKYTWVEPRLSWFYLVCKIQMCFNVLPYLCKNVKYLNKSEREREREKKKASWEVGIEKFPADRSKSPQRISFMEVDMRIIFFLTCIRGWGWGKGFPFCEEPD